MPHTRSTLALISGRLWPTSRKYPGIAHGWQGAAWVAFKLAGAGVAVPDRVFEAIGRRLAVELGPPPSDGHIGAMLGCAADAVIAGYAARHGIVRRSVARTACRRALAMSRNNPAWDVQLGRGGMLLALLEIAAVEPGALGDFRPAPVVARLMTAVDALCAMPVQGWHTGMAHGPAGAIMALESCAAAGWCQVTTTQRQRWLDLLAGSALSSPAGGLLWPQIAGRDDLGLQSWCAGTPGVALAMLQCFRLTGEPVYLEIARGALEGMKELADGVFSSPTLCCGSAGYHHIFVEAYRVSGDDQWLAAAAREPRLSTTAGPRLRLGLLQGQLGIAYLGERLANPRAYPLPALGASSM